MLPTESAKSNGPVRRLPGLDLLRAIAILWVMLFHAWAMLSASTAIDAWRQPFAAFQSYGWMGVDLFFVLSGYLIGFQVLKPLSEGKPLSLGQFYLRRAFRILPVYVVVLALYYFWPAFREASGMQPLWQFLTFTVNLLIDPHHNLAFSHAWSLCVEEHFYLVFPWLALWLARRPSAIKFASAFAFVLVGGIVLRGFVWMHWLAPVLHQDAFNTRFLQDIYYPTWCRLDGLLDGVALATIRAYRPFRWTQLQQYANAWLLFGLVLVAAAIVLFRDRAGLVATVVGYPVLALGFASMVIAGANTQSWLGRMRIPGARWIALISYSLYLSHKAVLHLVDGALARPMGEHVVLAFFIYALAVLLAGALLHYAVERPFLRLRERRFETPRQGMPHSLPSQRGPTPDL